MLSSTLAQLKLRIPLQTHILDESLSDALRSARVFTTTTPSQEDGPPTLDGDLEARCPQSNPSQPQAPEPPTIPPTIIAIPNAPPASPAIPLPPKRKESEFELMTRTLQSILSSIQWKTKGKPDLREIADIAVISDYAVLSHHLQLQGHRSPKIAASLQIANCKLAATTNTDGNPVVKGAWFARTLREKAEHVRRTGSLPERKQGKGGRHFSLFDCAEVRTAVETFFTETTAGDVSP